MYRSFFRPLLRVVVVLGLLSVPVIAADSVTAGNDIRVAAQAAPKTGLGLFLVVSLRRAS
jgi:hypothetical protein